MKKSFFICFAIATSLATNTYSQIIINPAGNGLDYDESSMKSFRSTDVAKAYDVDGDDVYGTAGLFFIGNGNAGYIADTTFNNYTQVGASWATFSSGSDATAYYTPLAAWAGYADIDDPTVTAGANVADWAIQSGYVRSTAAGIADVTWHELLQFTIGQNTPEKFRVGIMSATMDHGIYAPSALSLSVNSSVAEVINLAMTADAAGMVFFDVDLNGETSGTFSIKARCSTASAPGIAGVTFDETSSTVIVRPVGDGWGYDETGANAFRSTNVAKSFDGDDDNVYGTEGLFFIGNSSLAFPKFDRDFVNFTKIGATWATFSPGANASYYVSPSSVWDYADIDDPTATPGANASDWAIQSGFVRDEAPGNTGDWEELLTFDIDETTPQKFRIGVMAANMDYAGVHPTGLRIQAGGSTATVGGLNTAARLTGMVFFDVDLNGETLGTFSIQAQRPSDAHGGGIAGITFDEISPSTDFLFGMFDGMESSEAISSGAMTMVADNDPWTISDNWAVHDGYDETDVFHAELSHTSAAMDWTIRIGKGGHIYSIVLPEIGEITPPQRVVSSPWNDEVMHSVLFSKYVFNYDDEMNGRSGGFIHGSGMYVRPEWYGELNSKPFYGPMLAEKADPTRRTYSAVNWQVSPNPTVNRTDVMFYVNYRDMGSNVIEMTYYFYNFGDITYTLASFPWWCLRDSYFPDIIRGTSGTNYETFVEGQNYVLFNYGGWIGQTADVNDPSALTVGLVGGVDHHYAEQAALKAAGQEYWLDSPIQGGGGSLEGVGGERDFKIMTTHCPFEFKPGKGFFYRTYAVFGELADVAQTAVNLVDKVDYGEVEYDEQAAGLLPLYEATVDGQMILTADRPSANAPSVASSQPIPMNDALPLMLMKEVGSGTYVLTTDPYAVSSKEWFPNPYPLGHERYEEYQNRVVYRPEDDRTEWVGLLGYVMPADPVKLAGEWQLLSTVLGEGIVFVPGEKLGANELMIWTGSPEVATGNNLPSFVSDTIVAPSVDHGVSYSSQVVATDADGDSLTYEKVIGPAWLTVSANGTLTGTASYADQGLNTWSIQVSDGNGGIDVLTLQILVNIDYSQISIQSITGTTGYHVEGNEAKAYRSTSVAKTYDVDGDEAYGTAGSFFFGDGITSGGVVFEVNTNESPDWVINYYKGDDFSYVASYYPYTTFDDPTLDISPTVSDWAQSAIVLTGSVGSSGAWVEVFKFAVDETAPKNIRIGLMAGNEQTASGIYDPAGIRLSFDGSPYTEITELPVTDLGIVFFDVTIPKVGPSGGTFSIQLQKRTEEAGVSLAGVVFDIGNQAPVAYSDSITTTGDAAVNITLTGDDFEDGSLAYSVVSQPANGTLSGTAPNLTYTPNPDYIGSDSFTFILSDGALDSAAATVSIIVGASDYNSWLSLYPALTDVTALGDPEADGIENLIEYVLNGTPTAVDTLILPELDATGENFVFTFTRRVESAVDTTQVFQYCSTLQADDWTDVSITDPKAIEVNLGTVVDGLQGVTVTISKSVAVDEKLFGRLKVTFVE